MLTVPCLVQIAMGHDVWQQQHVQHVHVGHLYRRYVEADIELQW